MAGTGPAGGIGAGGVVLDACPGGQFDLDAHRVVVHGVVVDEDVAALSNVDSGVLGPTDLVVVNPASGAAHGEDALLLIVGVAPGGEPETVHSGQQHPGERVARDVQSAQGEGAAITMVAAVTAMPVTRRRIKAFIGYLQSV